MLKISTSFPDLIGLAADLIGPPADREDVHIEYSRGVLELTAVLSVGTEEHARRFVADSLDLDPDALYGATRTNRIESDLAKVRDVLAADDDLSGDYLRGAVEAAASMLGMNGDLGAVASRLGLDREDVYPAPEANHDGSGSHERVVDALAEAHSVISRLKSGRIARESEINSVLTGIEVTGLLGTSDWYHRTPFRHDDSGDVGGDTQEGPAHSLSWQRRLPDGTFETLTLYHFAAANDASQNLPRPASWSFWTETMIELIRHRNATDPGGTEIMSDYRYESSVSHPSLAVALQAARRYTDDNTGTDPQTLWWQI